MFARSDDFPVTIGLHPESALKTYNEERQSMFGLESKCEWFHVIIGCLP